MISATILTHSLSTKAENIVKECAGITAVCHANSNRYKTIEFNRCKTIFVRNKFVGFA